MRIITGSTLLLCLCGQLAGSTATAAPSLTVTGRTQLRLTGVNRTLRGRVTIRGDLRDTALLAGISGELVEVRLFAGRGFVRQLVRTDAHGGFAVQWPLPMGTYPVEARYRGTRLYAPSQVGPLSLDVSKLTLSLELRPASKGSRALDAARPTQRLLITAQAGGEAVDVELRIVALSTRDAGERALGTARTGPQGRLVLSVPTRALGRPGPLTLVARFAGSPNLNPAAARCETMLVTPVTLRMTAEGPATIPADGRVKLGGAVRDGLGPVVGGTVSLHVQGRHRATTLTGRRGEYRFELPAERFPPGALELEARFTPVVLWRRAGKPARVTLRILPPRPIPFWVYAVPAAATTLLVAVLLLLRFRPRLRLGRRVEPDRKPPDASPRGAADLVPLASGVRLSHRSLRNLLVADHGIAGAVWDAADEVPLAGALVELTPIGKAPAEATDRSVVGGPTGTFSAEGLTAGQHRVRVSKSGFVAESFEIQIPHRGNLRGLKVLLVPIRVRVLELYRDVALPRLPRAELWACWTPRDLLDHLAAAGRRDGHLTALSDLLERVYWGPPPPSDGALGRARDLSRALAGER